MIDYFNGDVAGFGLGNLLNQIRLAQWFHDSVLELGFVQAVGFLGCHRHLHLPGDVGDIRDGIPSGKKFVAVGIEFQLD